MEVYIIAFIVYVVLMGCLLIARAKSWGNELDESLQMLDLAVESHRKACVGRVSKKE